MRAADHAEMLGDAEGALEIIRQTPLGPDGKPFWRPWRIRNLHQLVAFEQDRPSWTTSRWILAQALSYQPPAARPLHRQALARATRVRGGPEMLPGYDEVDAACQVLDFDWVYRQSYLYDLGGLRAFLRTGATAGLLAGADRIADWEGARMASYRHVDEDRDRIIWDDLATLERVEVLNVGSAMAVIPGDCVIGRVVPIEGGAMFESEPLFVPEPVAARVAEDPSRWVDAVVDGCGEFGVAPTSHTVDRFAVPEGTIVVTKPDGVQIFTDVIREIWRQLAAEAPPETRYVESPDAVTNDAMTLLGIGLAMTDEDDLGPRLCQLLGAALIEPGVEELLRTVVQPYEYDEWSRLAGQVPGISAVVCRRVLDGLRAAS